MERACPIVPRVLPFPFSPVSARLIPLAPFLSLPARRKIPLRRREPVCGRSGIRLQDLLLWSSMLVLQNEYSLLRVLYTCPSSRPGRSGRKLRIRHQSFGFLVQFKMVRTIFGMCHFEESDWLVMINGKRLYFNFISAND